MYVLVVEEEFVLLCLGWFVEVFFGYVGYGLWLCYVMFVVCWYLVCRLFFLY